MSEPPDAFSAPQDQPDLEAILGEVRLRLKREKFETWFNGFSLLRWTLEEIEFGVQSVFVRDWIMRNYLGELEAAVSRVLRGSSAEGEEEGVCPRRRIRISVIQAPQAQPTTLGLAERAPHTKGAEAPQLAASYAGAPQQGGGQAVIAAALASGPDWVQKISAVPVPSLPPAAGGNGVPLAGAGDSTLGAPSPYTQSQLIQNYTFDQFVVGDCNRLAHAAALAAGEQPGRSYNPLFIHGSVGLGKTHLLQAICHSVLRRYPGGRVVYLSCEEFTNRFIKAIETKNLDAFRSFHRTADVLVVDDVDFLASKERTQEEFFHTFNDLFHSNKQIVLSSDRPPIEIPTLEERLVSRFKWGLVTDIAPPCFETRVAILKRKCRSRNQELQDDVAYFIAERIDTNIRELEGALIQVLGMAKMTERSVTLEVAEEALRGASAPRATMVTLPMIMNLITSEFGISARELTSESRRQVVSFPRQVGMYLARTKTKHSYEEVGRFFGRRDHTTAMYAYERIKQRLATDRRVRELIETLEKRLRA